MDQEDIITWVEEILEVAEETGVIGEWARCPGVLTWDVFPKFTDGEIIQITVPNPK